VGQATFTAHNGTPTTVVLSEYADRVLVAVAQRPVFGAIVHAVRRAGSPAVVDTSVLLGPRDDDVLVLVARQLLRLLPAASGGALLGDGDRRSLLVTVALDRAAHTADAALQIVGEAVSALALSPAIVAR
jgi:hypothetical protein